METKGSLPSLQEPATGHYSKADMFFFSWCEMRLSPLGTSDNNGPIVQVPDDRC
jgi:hypothetical protein